MDNLQTIQTMMTACTSLMATLCVLLTNTKVEIGTQTDFDEIVKKRVAPIEYDTPIRRRGRPRKLPIDAPAKDKELIRRRSIDTDCETVLSQDENREIC